MRRVGEAVVVEERNEQEREMRRGEGGSGGSVMMAPIGRCKTINIASPP